MWFLHDQTRRIGADRPPARAETHARWRVHLPRRQIMATRFDGRQAKEALGDDWQGWWSDDDDGGGDDRPLPQQPLPEPA
ncbi:hypothetical protein [Sinorhizobium medicae]|uniref:hypothetical protein n=1 Tax=Sinorhizobium medicae TaxID=110321 RepID=UPI0000DDFFBF